MFFANPASRPAGSETGGFTAPQLGSNQTASAQNTYIALISLGIIGAIPEVVKIAKGLLKGQLGVDAGSAMKNLATGWKGGEIVPGLGVKVGARSFMPDKLADAVPFGLGDTVPFRTTGKGTALERFMFGSREERKRELEYQRQAALFGKNIRIRQGGVVGGIMNAWGAQKAAQEQRGGGAGAHKT